MNWFRQEPITRYQLIEVEKLTPLEDATHEVASLRGHSGFQWLCRKLKLQAALLQAKLNTSRNENDEDIYLKTGIFWCSWLQSQVDFACAKLKSREASPEETELFNQISSTIERIGHNPTADGSI